MSSLVGLALLLEFVVRIYSVMFFPRMMRIDDELGWRHGTNIQKIFVNEDNERILVEQNSYGHRGPEPRTVKLAGTQRILVLGDSFTEAVQVADEDLFTARVAASQRNLEMLNAGVGGWGTVQQYLYLTREGLAFDPDVVLLMAYDNDLVDNCLSYSPGIGPRPYAAADPANQAVIIHTELDPSEYGKFVLRMPFWNQLNKHSYFYTFLNTRVYQKLAASRLRIRSQIDYEKARNCGGREIFFDLVQRMAQWSSQERVEFYIALIPTAEAAELGRSQNHESILRFCRSRGLKCASLLIGLYQAVRSGLRPYFDEDIHWTADGHAIVAEELGLFLQLDQQ